MNRAGKRWNPKHSRMTQEGEAHRCVSARPCGCFVLGSHVLAKSMSPCMEALLVHQWLSVKLIFSVLRKNPA